ncbi:hypothetical protein BJ508DRAFT_418704 [Ascobolus immersus RN42]|uniref:CHCH domain-containing protein n=1 Tax=Ascobolus immersus RN42 TaxID=1160509 RepID=A0A3N4HX59_ASCIM|nr:hypothetical protein BJ508DRAFT_418704 [Ascobolus immersus RN42]
MARSRGGARPAMSAPKRPAAPPARAPAPQQQRPASTSAVPATTQQAGPPAVPQQGMSQGPGLFGQMASTAAGVAVGSTVGHVLGAGITGMFGGGSSSEAAPVEAQAPAQNQSNNWGSVNCDADAKAFTKCLDENSGNMQICSWYLDQLKSCQKMAANY